MAFNLKKILSSLNETTSVFDEGTGEFNIVDLELAKKNLNLSERASQNGNKNIPSLIATKKDSMAAEIDDYLQHLIFMSKNKLVDRERAINDLSQTQADGGLEQITEIFEDGKAKLNTTARATYNDLFVSRRDWVLGEKEITKFRKVNKIDGPARFDENNSKNYGWIFALTIIEVIVNSFFLGDAHPQGPSRVFVEIFMFGLINIGLSFILGNYIWRGFYHINTFRKLWAGLLSTFLLISIVGINFLVGHYRDGLERLSSNQNLNITQMGSVIQEIGNQALNTFFTNPFLMSEFKSYIFVILGIIASTFAIIKSFQLDDPYPKYGKLSREQSKLAENFNDMQTDAFEEMDELVNVYSTQINNQLNVLKGNERSIVDRQESRKQLLEKYENWLNSVQSVGVSLYAFYREENTKARKNKKEPKCFLSFDYQLPKNAQAKLKPQSRIVSSFLKAQKKCEKLINILNRQSENYQKEFKDIEKMSPDKVLSERISLPTVFENV